MTDGIGISMRTHVVAGVLRDAQGRVLLAQRPRGKQHAGYWEFPGGKVESGETPQAALIRELVEELGIRVQPGTRLIAVPMGAIVLDVFRIDRFDGEPHGRDGQALTWIDPAHIDPLMMPPADRPVLTALCLPDRYLITPLPGHDTRAFLAQLEQSLCEGIRLVQLRMPGWDRSAIAPLAREVRAICARHAARLLLNADWQLAGLLGLDGVHLPARIARDLRRRPVPAHQLLAISCHDADELAHAASIGADFATLSPIHSTPDHAGAQTLGWQAAAQMIAASPLPVFALGGLQVADIATAHAYGAQGIAAIRGLWSKAWSIAE